MQHDDVAIDKIEAGLSAEERTLLDELADGIAARRLTPAALFFLESVKPMGFMTSQVLHFCRPIVQTIWTSPARYDALTRVLEQRGSIELLLRRLEARS